MTNAERLIAIEAVADTLLARSSHPDRSGVYVDRLQAIRDIARSREDDTR